MNARRDRRGFVLLAILVAIILASMVALSLMFRLRAESMAGAGSAGSEQAWAAAMSGIDSAIDAAADAPPGSLDWREAPARFKHQWVCDDGAEQWFVTVYSPGDATQPGLRFGLTDEASKFHLADASEEALTQLPLVTAAHAQALLDFTDRDDEARPEGAEREYYERLGLAVAPRNRPLTSLEELLLIRDFTPELVFGEDANISGVLDPNEDDGDVSAPPDNSNGLLDRGLRQWLTVDAYDLNLDRDRLPRLNMNEPGLTFFQVDLPDQTKAYLAQLRSNNVAIAHPAELLDASITNLSGGVETVVESGLGPDELPVALDQLTGTTNRLLRGLININTAPAWVLLTLPGIDLSLAESIVAARRGLTDDQRQSIAWLVQRKVMDATLFKSIASRLTARSLQFRFKVVAYGLPSGRYRVLEVVIDLATPVPSIKYLRDVSRLGLPFQIGPDGPIEPHHG